MDQIWKKWLAFGRVIGDVIGRLVLTIFYFTIFVPFGLITRLLRDPLTLRISNNIRWTERTTKDRTLDDVRRLY